ncbi:TPA: hypothetical protein ACGZ99_000650 [Elizabethkingia anophelis]
MQIKTTLGDISIDRTPEECPFCHTKINPNIIYGYINKQDRNAEVFMSCPSTPCNKSFIAYYYEGSHRYFFDDKVTHGNVITENFPSGILEISPSFSEIYSQAYAAEQQGLTEICGVGYRKSLEFLIKDYLILNNPSEQEKIEKKMLAQCIGEYVDNDKIKTVAKRAAWLGNDETHYVRKWEGRNLGDLKNLIKLTVHWIEMELLTKEFEESMPE